MKEWTIKELLAIPIDTLVCYVQDGGRIRYCKLARVDSDDGRVWGNWCDTKEEALRVSTNMVTNVYARNPEYYFKIVDMKPNWREVLSI